jgi:hypothetical protein
MQQREHGKQRGNLRKKLQANPTKHAFSKGLGSRTSSRPPRPNRFGCVGVYCGCLRYCCPMVATGRSHVVRVAWASLYTCSGPGATVPARTAPIGRRDRGWCASAAARTGSSAPPRCPPTAQLAELRPCAKDPSPRHAHTRMHARKRVCTHTHAPVRMHARTCARALTRAHSRTHRHAHARHASLCDPCQAERTGSSWTPLCRDGKARAGQYRQPSRAIERRGNAAQRP